MGSKAMLCKVKHSMKHDYKILSSRTIGDLIDEVNMHIQDGWTPIGGVAINPFVTQNTFVQAMIRNDPARWRVSKNA